MQRVETTYDFASPVDRVYAYLVQHENLAALFGAKVLEVRPGESDRNGTGSVRRMQVGRLPAFEETVVRAVPNELIHYRITKGGILREHAGNLSFQPRGAGSRLHYAITFRGVVPGIDRLVKRSLEQSLRTNLPKVDAAA